MRKQVYPVLLCLALAAGILSGCGGGGNAGTPHAGSAGDGSPEAAASEAAEAAVLEATETSETTETAVSETEETTGTAAPLHIVATIFPVYDWVRQILGGRTDADGVELALLLDSGVDMHSYQPTVGDMVTISACDLFLYVGGESDQWVDRALKEAANPDRKVLNLLNILGDAAKEEETIEGMQTEAEEPETPEYDEHVWLSLKNAQVFCRAIADALAALDPAHAQEYAENLRTYQARLAALDAQYEDMVQSASVKTLLFGDRFPFRYLTDDYGLNYYAAFSGCSAETEASFETVVFLAGQVDALHLPAVLTIETSDGKIARTIVENTAEKSAQVLQMDSMQSTSFQDAVDGATYLDAMEHNLEVLREALRVG